MPACLRGRSVRENVVEDFIAANQFCAWRHPHFSIEVRLMAPYRSFTAKILS